jgi:hypothetical protein
MDIEQSANKNVLNYLLRPDSYRLQEKLDAPMFALWNGHADPYWKLGCHPETVQRLWDEIGPQLPEDCRSLVCLTPALVHPRSGVVLGLVMGTEYVLRLPGETIDSAFSTGAKRIMRFSTGDTINLEEIFGDEWIFGAWLNEELAWCRRAYDLFTRAV